jgi:dTDP-4-amino-4,6-dideoxygalactose transaminase
MTDWRVPFNRPTATGHEMAAIGAAFASGHFSGDGPFTRACHRILESAAGVRKALLTTSCTHALEMAALLLNVQPNDEIIVPSFTFVSTVNAFALRGARLVFVDIRGDTFNIDESRIAEALTPRTKAIVVVHYAGVGCEMDAIMEIARAHAVPVVEDNAHGLFGSYRGRPLGSFGALAALSFHETKNFTCGEGGAILIQDEALVDRAEIIREKGTDRSRFFRGEVDKYGWVDFGSSYLPSELLAAMLHAQLERRAEIQAKRRRIWERYRESLREWAADRDIRLPYVPANVEQAFHMFHLLMPTTEARDNLIAHLRERGILAVFHYLPLHTTAFAHRIGARTAGCPITEDVSARLVRLPFFTQMTDLEHDYVLSALAEFHVHR